MNNKKYLILALLIGLTLGLGISMSFKKTTRVNAEISPEYKDSILNLKNTSKAFVAVVHSVKPAVVNISAERTVKNPYSEYLYQWFGDDFMERFFGIPRGDNIEPKRKEQSLGSGVIVDEKGYILTNNHVIENADNIKVKLSDEREFKAEIIGTDPKSDLAVIKIDGKDLPVAILGNSDKIEVGDWVLAIGNPFGLSQTVTAGIISAKGRNNIGVADYEDFIQTDASINPGNSGGPLVNLNGKVIGINTAIFSRTGGNMGIGFAIPSNIAKKILKDLIKNKKVIRGWLGVMIQPVTEDIAKKFSLPEKSGVLIADVRTDGPADKAGIKRGDVIIKYDGVKVKSDNDLRNRVASTDVGKLVSCVVIRDGEEKIINVRIGEQPEDMEAAFHGTTSKNASKLGITVQKLTPELAKNLNIDRTEGIIITHIEPGSPADKAHLKRGDLILEIDRYPIRTMKDFNNAIANADLGDGILLLIEREGITQYQVIR